ncbi:MAG: bifunctional diaminohydroxyphosphoribosylaminopyrimidine deaminase/5-amino-6-(5-phosphoribosylamino)uracil reductase RibD [Tissierellia bacterium]|nr:bifunctional diaminohydroxyphosphoribosylaminopyrimidine deaminase/5-amino-6-(5-phosphoribosylamino)uracil reductase RibD [Tissierellia bacterium]
MEMALNLAKKGIGFTNPNPLVGAVIVKDGKVIGKGYHEKYGENHAEINALNNAKEDVHGATMYVNLEPCSHFGNVPPCVNRIIESGIKKVVIAMEDPNPIVSGKGIQILKENGLEVKIGVLKKEAEKLNEIFIKYISTGKPFVILKAGMSLDGKIATYTGDSRWITGKRAREYVHILRQRVSAILVGVNTVIVDDPMLNTRLNNIECKDPIRIILDSHGRTPLKSNVLNTNPSNTIVAVTNNALEKNIKAIEKIGAEVMITPVKDGKVDLQFLMEKLGERKIDSLLIEGGGEINFSFLKEKLVDKVIFFIAPKIIGGETSKTPVEGKGVEYLKDAIDLKDITMCKIGDDIMVEGYLS